MSQQEQDHDANGDEWYPWAEFPAGDLKRKIEEAYGGRPGEHHVIEVKVHNPISGYRVLRPPPP